VEDVVALLEGTYDIHTNFKYTFQEKDYKNLMREKSFEKECKKKPDLSKIKANGNN
jgi:acetate kinase